MRFRSLIIILNPTAMARRVVWHDEYWLLLVQLYLKKPVGVKPLYSKGLVDIALELHIAPEYLFRQLDRLSHPDSPTLQQLLDTYAHKPAKLTSEIKKVRQMKGFGHADEFYKDVEVVESWEREWKPVTTQEEYACITPAMLILILNLYYQLVPDTMVKDTPEVVELAQLLHVKVSVVTEVMEVLRSIDPTLPNEGFMMHPLLNACLEVWKEWGNEDLEKIAAEAEKIKEYYR